MNRIPGSLLFVLLLTLLFLSGCATPTATVDLMGVAKQGLASAQQAQQQSHTLILRQYQSQQARLDAAFDADARLVEAGELKNAQGQPVALSATWVISARKGYSAAQNLLAEQIRKEQQAHAIEQDNLKAAAEALELAQELTILQWNVGERIKQQFLKFSKRKKQTSE